MKWRLSKIFWGCFNISGKHHAGLFFSVSKNKGIEINFYNYFNWKKFDYFFWIRRRQDHPGVTFEIILFGLGFEIEFYDGRHWDTKNDCYQTYPEDSNG